MRAAVFEFERYGNDSGNEQWISKIAGSVHKDFFGAPADKYEQAIQGLFTAGTSGFRDLRKAEEGRRKEKVGCKRGIEAVDRCR